MKIFMVSRTIISRIVDVITIRIVDVITMKDIREATNITERITKLLAREGRPITTAAHPFPKKEHLSFSLYSEEEKPYIGPTLVREATNITERITKLLAREGRPITTAAHPFEHLSFSLYSEEEKPYIGPTLDRQKLIKRFIRPRSISDLQWSISDLQSNYHNHESYIYVIHGYGSESSWSQLFPEWIPETKEKRDFSVAIKNLVETQTIKNFVETQTIKNLVETQKEKENESAYAAELNNISEQLHEADDRIAETWEEIDRLGKKTRAKIAELEELLD